jgi:hypothetical protein
VRTLVEAKGIKAFTELHRKFLGMLSAEILSGHEYRAHSDLITFGFFIRAANIAHYFSSKETREGYIAVGAGVAMHIAPSNIPMNFAFSWLYGFISGCRNIVRLPSARYEQVDMFLRAFEKTASSSVFKHFAETNYFFRTARESAMLDALVPSVDALLVWGGDATVDYFRKLVQSPSARQLYFPSRQSSLILHSKNVIEVLGSSQKDEFLRRAYNDTFLTDCNACSSPSKVFFVGEERDSVKASELFFSYLESFVRNQEREIPIVRRMMDSLASSGSSEGRVEFSCHGMAIRGIRTLDGQMSIKRALRFGAFLVSFKLRFEDVLGDLSQNEQTLIHWGFTEADLFTFVSLLGPLSNSASRVVPLGSALDIGFFWEGRDNPTHLVKYLEVKT